MTSISTFRTTVVPRGFFSRIRPRGVRASSVVPGLFIGFLLITLVCGCKQQQMNNGMPAPDPSANVIVISFDAFRQDSIGAYGSERALTPNIDKFAANGTVFRNAYTAGQATPSSFAAAFTGQLPVRVFRKWKLLDVDTVADLYQRAGFDTAAFVNNVQLTPERDFDQGFDHYEMFADRSDQNVLAAVKEWLEKDHHKKFFLWVHFINPHTPYEVRDVSKHLYSDGYSGPFEKRSPPNIQEAARDTYTEADYRRLKELYDGEVYYLDQIFGELIGAIEQSGYDEDSLVLLTADHGEEFGEHNYFGHKQLYEEVIRIPMILSYPEMEPTLVDIPVSNLDLLPTLVEFSELKTEQVAEGQSWYNDLSPDRPIFSMVMTNKKYFAFGVRSGNHKMISWCNQEQFREEVYDLSIDPKESNNLFETEVVLSGHLYEIMETVEGRDPCLAIRGATKGRAQQDGLADESIEKLKSLGYIQ